MDSGDNNGGTFTGPYTGTDVPFSLGAQLSDGSGIFGGFFGSEKEVRMYSRALTGTEISTLYKFGVPCINNVPTVGDQIICGSGSISLHANGGSDFRWYDENGNFIFQGNTVV